MKKLFSILFSFTLFFGVMAMMPTAPVHAQILGGSTSCAGGDCPQQGLNAVKSAFPAGATQEQDLPALIYTIINWALYLAAIAAVLFIIYGGYLYITSAGNDSTAKTGRTALTNAIIGLVIVVLSYMIVQVVYSFLTR